MTAKMTRNILIMLVATVLMGIVLNLYIHNTGTVPAADNAATLTDGTYTSSAQGCLSEVTVTLTVTGGKVTAVQVDEMDRKTQYASAAPPRRWLRSWCRPAPPPVWMPWPVPP